MEYVQALVLGVVQGITEFLPISSDGHLFIVREIFSWPDQGLLFDAVLHLGTLAAIVIVLWRELLELLVGVGHIISRRTLLGSPQARLAAAVIIATIPAAVVGYFFEDVFAQTYRNTLSVGLWFAATGAFYFLAEQIIRAKDRTTPRPGARPESKTRPSLVGALVIGLAQVSALLPGVSRSGTTIATGSLLGLTREAAARFSFVMATPIIAGASVLSLLQLITSQNDVASTLNNGVATTLGGAVGSTQSLSSQWGPLIVGTLAALLVGVVALKGLLRLVKRRGLRVFGSYLLVLGAVVVGLSALGIW